MILCCGEALIDMVPAQTADGQTAFVPHSGGAVFNTAVALGRLDVPVGLVTGVSTDMFGQQLLEDMRASHVETQHVIQSPRPGTLAFVQLVDGHARYAFYDEGSAGRLLRPQDMPEVSDEVGALYFGGISLACDPGADAYAALCAREGARRVVMIDPNIRPDFITDDARFRARLQSMIRLADIVKVSDEDLDWIIPDAPSRKEQLRQLLALGPAMVIMTQGGEGALAALADGRQVRVAATPAQVVDTIGAGDTFNAGVLASLFRNGVLTKEALAEIDTAHVQEALGYGARVAAITVSRAGANPPWSSELDPAV